MTDILKYIDVNPDEAKKLAQRMHMKKDDIQLIRKGYEVKIEDQDDEERTITARVSTADVDRDGEIVEPKGIELKDYRSNPVLAWCHKYDHPAVGKALWSQTDKNGLICKFKFAETQFADDLYQLYKGGFMKAFSIGFIPVEYDQKTKTHQKISLLEVSCVLVPANQNALVMEAYSKGIIKSDVKSFIDEAMAKGEENAPLAIETDAKTPDPVDILAEVHDDIASALQKNAEENIAKAFDMEKNPSVWDVINAVNRALNPQEIMGAYKFLEDFYPVEYPNGHCVYSAKNEDGVMESFMVDYTYGKGVASIGENPVPVVVAWKRGTKGFKAEGDKTVGEMTVKMNLDADEFNAKIESIQAKLEEVLSVKNAVLEVTPTPPPVPPEDILASIETKTDEPPVKSHDMTPEQVQAAVIETVGKLDLKGIIDKGIKLELDKIRGKVR